MFEELVLLDMIVSSQCFPLDNVNTHIFTAVINQWRLSFYHANGNILQPCITTLTITRLLCYPHPDSD